MHAISKMVWGAAQRGIDDLVDRLQRNDAALTSLCLLRGRRFNDDDAQALAAALEINTTLRELSISSHSVSPAAAAAVARALALNRTLRSLDLGNRSFGDEGLAALAPGIAASASLRHLNLEAKGLTSAGCSALAAALTATTKPVASTSAVADGGDAGSAEDCSSKGGIEELLLGQNALGSEGLAALLEGLGSGPSSLRQLDLSSCGLAGASSAQPLAAALQQGQLAHLQLLRLDGNNLGAEGAAALAPALSSAGAASLRQLHLQSCSLGPAGVAALAASLPAQLHVLDVSGNSLGEAGAAALAAALAAGAAPQLRRLLLCGSGLDGGSVAALAAALASRRSTAAAAAAVEGPAALVLDLSANAASAAAVAALALAPLSGLCLHDCKLDSEAAAALAEQLAAPAAFAELEELDVSGNRLEAAQLVPLLDALTTPPATDSDGDSSSPPAPCPRLRLLVIAANPGASEEAVAAAVEGLQAARPGLDVVRRAADTGEGGLMR